MNIKVKETINIEDYLVNLLDDHSQMMNPEMPTDYTKKEYAFGIYEDETLIGGLTAKEAMGEFYISLIAINKDYRQLGLGRLLMKAVEEKAKERGCHHLLLTTYSYQGAHFYPKVGFKLLAKISDYPVVGVDKLYFIKYL